MRPRKVYDLVRRHFDHLSFELKKDEMDQVEFTAEITAEKYFDDGVYIDIVAYKSGTYHVFFTFDSLEPTFDALTACNNFNKASAFFSSYVCKRGNTNFLELHYSGVGFDGVTEEEVADNIIFGLNELLSDDTLEYLQPLTRLTR